ncbi:MarC family protein [Thioclava sp. GXIMD4216]|uniref:UPF0056 membrane protein n=1 Tax=Thioclava litoralis TaxID=3076557 RepID=A0ABZ1DWJ8_9RHOB|nr:MarC family protein [Thioclava sp. FTW29]
MAVADYLTAFVTLFVVIDPIGLAPVFMALTSGVPTQKRRGIGFRAVAIGAVLLTLFGLFGQNILDGIGISMPAFRIAGGVLLFLTALDMLFERRTKRRQDQGEEHAQDPDHDDPSVFPLATPLIAGPGAMASMILLTGQGDGTALHTIAILGVMLAVLLCVMASFAIAAPVERLLGRTGVMVVTRLLGMLLAALAIQFMLDGLHKAGLSGIL